MRSTRELAADIAERKRAEQVQAAIYRTPSGAQTAKNTGRTFLLELWIHAIIGELMPARNFYIALYDCVRRLVPLPLPYRRIRRCVVTHGAGQKPDRLRAADGQAASRDAAGI